MGWSGRQDGGGGGELKTRWRKVRSRDEGGGRV